MFSDLSGFKVFGNHDKRESVEEIQKKLDDLEELMKRMESMGKGDEFRATYDATKYHLESMLVEAAIEEHREKYYAKKEKEDEKSDPKKEDYYSDKSYIDLE